MARSDGKLCGFALIDLKLQQGDGPGRYVAEFFVLRTFRKQGIGQELARQLFDTYRGVWEIAEVGPNTPAQAFWRRVIGEYTGGRYREFPTEDNEGLTILWQTFDSSGW
jgi:predicted acetyltransferase